VAVVAPVLLVQLVEQTLQSPLVAPVESVCNPTSQGQIPTTQVAVAPEPTLEIVVQRALAALRPVEVPLAGALQAD
jgi:hypothetical protein